MARRLKRRGTDCWLLVRCYRVPQFEEDIVGLFNRKPVALSIPETEPGLNVIGETYYAAIYSKIKLGKHVVELQAHPNDEWGTVMILWNGHKIG